MRTSAILAHPAPLSEAARAKRIADDFLIFLNLEGVEPLLDGLGPLGRQVALCDGILNLLGRDQLEAARRLIHQAGLPIVFRSVQGEVI